MPYPELNFVFPVGTTIAEALATLSSIRGMAQVAHDAAIDPPDLPTGCGIVSGDSIERALCKILAEVLALMKYIKCLLNEPPADWQECVDAVQAELDKNCEACEGVA